MAAKIIANSIGRNLVYHDDNLLSPKNPFYKKGFKIYCFIAFPFIFILLLFVVKAKVFVLVDISAAIPTWFFRQYLTELEMFFMA